jgi:hypothetical protein
MPLTGVHPDTFGEPSPAELAAALTGVDFLRTAVRNLEGPGVPRSTAMAMVGHLPIRIYSRYAIADEFMLKGSARKIEPAT